LSSTGSRVKFVPSEIGPGLGFPGAYVIKLFKAVIYHHTTVIPSFCVVKLYYHRNYCGMAENYRGILTLEKVGLEFTDELFYNIGPRVNSSIPGPIRVYKGL
jgi:hypothetical protein